MDVDFGEADVDADTLEFEHYLMWIPILKTIFLGNFSKNRGGEGVGKVISDQLYPLLINSFRVSLRRYREKTVCIPKCKCQISHKILSFLVKTKNDP